MFATVSEGIKILAGGAGFFFDNSGFNAVAGFFVDDFSRFASAEFLIDVRLGRCGEKSGVVETGAVSEVFTRPTTEVARRLVYQGGDEVSELNTDRCIRIVFDGGSSYEPVIANMVLECRIPVNIIFANTKDIDGQAYGQIVLQLPDDEAQAQKAIYYLRSRNLTVEELDGFNG